MVVPAEAIVEVVVDEAIVEVVVDEAIVEVVVDGEIAGQRGEVRELSSKVTDAVWAKTPPTTLAPVSRVTEARARTYPEIELLVPRVAELPTCQKMLQAVAPFSRTTEEPEPNMRVEEGAWKTHTAAELFWALRVSTPLVEMARLLAEV